MQRMSLAVITQPAFLVQQQLVHDIMLTDYYLSPVTDGGEEEGDEELTWLVTGMVSWR